MSASYFNEDKLPKFRYPTTILERLIKQNKDYIIIQDSVEYRRCKVRLHAQGIELRDVVKGEKIRTKKQYVCKANQFLVAEIDAKVGGYGIVPKFLEGAIVSNHYFLYDIDNNKLLPDFLDLFIKTDAFHSQIKAIGSTNYAAIRSYQVLEYMIPLPSLTIQKKLVKEYESKIQEAQKAEKQAYEIEENIEKYLFDILGIEIEKSKEKKQNEEYNFLQFVDFEDMDRWDVYFLEKKELIKDIFKVCNYNIIPFGQVVKETQYGISEKAHKEPKGFPMLRMNNILNGELNISDLKYVEIENNKLSRLLLQKDDFLFNRTNSKELVGKTTVFDIDGDYLFASYLIRLKLNLDKVNIYFVNYLFNSSIIRIQINTISRQILGQANINLSELKSLLIPLPPLFIQSEIVTHIQKQKTEIKRLKAKAESLRNKAKVDFENEIFINKPTAK